VVVLWLLVVVLSCLVLFLPSLCFGPDECPGLDVNTFGPVDDGDSDHFKNVRGPFNKIWLWLGLSLRCKG
jgi:hypothetical protein